MTDTDTDAPRPAESPTDHHAPTDPATADSPAGTAARPPGERPEEVGDAIDD